MDPKPLVELGMNIINDDYPYLTSIQQNTIREKLLEFIQGSINYDTLLHFLSPIIDQPSAFEKIRFILNTKLDPIPESPQIDISGGSTRKKTRSWTPNEDNRLYMGVYLFGQDSWTSVAQYVGNGRTRSQCSQRWIRVLDPRISKNQWTNEEEKKLLELVQTYGEKSWMRIANELGNRSDVQCRYKYRQLHKDQLLLNDEISISSNTESTPSSNIESPTIQEKVSIQLPPSNSAKKSDDHSMIQNLNYSLPPKAPLLMNPPLMNQTPTLLYQPNIISNQNTNKNSNIINSTINNANTNNSSIKPNNISSNTNSNLSNNNISKIGSSQNLKNVEGPVEEPISLKESDFFKSDNLFDSNFWFLL